MKRIGRGFTVGSLAMESAFVSGPLAASGGFVAAGVSAAPDYEGGDDYTAAPALFGRYNFSEGRYLALVGGADAARSGRLVLNVVPNSAWEVGPALGFRYERNDPGVFSMTARPSTTGIAPLICLWKSTTSCRQPMPGRAKTD